MSSFIDLSDNETQRLKHRIEQDFRAARQDHQRRMKRNADYLKAWRSVYDPNPADDPDKPNFRVPLTKWHLFSKLSAELEALYGADVEIYAQPTGPADAASVKRVSLHMQWTLLNEMKAVRKIAVWNFRRALYGRAFALINWRYKARTRRVRAEPDPSSTLGLDRFENKQIVEYDGPQWQNIHPDDFIVPAEEVETLHDFSFVIHRERLAVDAILRDPIYREAKKHAKDLIELSRDPDKRAVDETGTDEYRQAMDNAEGLDLEAAESARDGVAVWHYYGRWRLPKGKNTDAEPDDLDNRDLLETNVLVHYQPDLDIVLSVQNLDRIYFEHSKPRPFIEGALVPDGSYWSMGYGEMLEDIEEELTSNHNLGAAAGRLTAAPVIFYSPTRTGGLNFDKFEYKGGTAIPCENPDAVNVVKIDADLTYPIANAQELTALAERLTGRTDFQLGRQSSAPNAPRTLGQHQLLLEAGNVRAAFDLRMLREDLADILDHIWRLILEFRSEHAFFRATEEEAGGLFEVRQGGASLDQKDRDGTYDFRIKFATSAASKEAEKTEKLQLYQLDLTNPLIATNPRALYKITKRLHRAFGDTDFERDIPMPPDMEPSIPPQEEHTKALQGEEVDVRPGDNDMEHIRAHDQFIRRLQAEGEKGDPQALERLLRHQQEHVRQLAQKRQMQMLMEQVTQAMPGLVDSLGGLQGLGVQAGQGAQGPSGPSPNPIDPMANNPS